MGIVDFVKRHQRKILVALGLSASVYWALGYLGDKLREIQEKIILDRITREDLERRFEQNQKDATFTTMALLPTASTQILDAFNVEETRRVLQELRGAEKGGTGLASSQELTSSQELKPLGKPLGNPLGKDPEGSQIEGSFVAAPSKAELWNKIKITSLTRAVLLVYVSALLTVFTRVQLNILGRKSYAESVEHATLEPGSVSEAALLADDEQADVVNRQYLTFSWWLLHKGWRLLAQRVQSAVELVTADVEPPMKMSFDALSELLGRIHHEVDSQGNFLGVQLPPPELETFVLSQIPGQVPSGEEAAIMQIDGPLRSLLDETRDTLSSPSSIEVVQRLVHSGLSVLMRKMRSLYDSETSEIRLAIALMQAAKQAHQMAAGSPLSNEYVEAMVDVPELDALSAAVYSNY